MNLRIVATPSLNNILENSSKLNLINLHWTSIGHFLPWKVNIKALIFSCDQFVQMQKQQEDCRLPQIEEYGELDLPF